MTISLETESPERPQGRAKRREFPFQWFVEGAVIALSSSMTGNVLALIDRVLQLSLIGMSLLSVTVIGGCYALLWLYARDRSPKYQQGVVTAFNIGAAIGVVSAWQ